MTYCHYYDEDNIRCGKTGSYNYKGQVQRKYCKDHKLENMFPVPQPRVECIHILENGKKCRTTASHSKPGEKRRTYCGKHKSPEMTSNKVKYCKCGNVPTYNLPNKLPRFCKYCKTKGMINTRKGKCITCGVRQAVYGYKSKDKPEYCDKCKKKDMINIIVRLCGKCGEKHRIYNYKGLPPEFCKDCKKRGMVNTKDKNRCKGEGCDKILHCKSPYEGYCSDCFLHLFPLHEKSSQIRQKTKELAVTNYIGTYTNKKDDTPFADFVHNKAMYISDCQTKRRVDLYKYIGDNHILCIEVDERQHKDYDKRDEEIRYNELYVPGYCMIYIRYNPDTYRDKNNKIQRPDFEYRMKILVKTIMRIEHNIKQNVYDINKELVYVEYLFYDKYQYSSQNKLKK